MPGIVYQLYSEFLIVPSATFKLSLKQFGESAQQKGSVMPVDIVFLNHFYASLLFLVVAILIQVITDCSKPSR